MKRSSNNLEELFQEIYRILDEEHEKLQKIKKIVQTVVIADLKQPFWETNKVKILTEIEEEIEEIKERINTITKYQERTTQLIELSCSRKKTDKQITNINESVKQIVERVVDERKGKYEYKNWIEEVYDPDLQPIKLNRLSLEIVLDNLINNAFDAVEAQINIQASYHPTVKIETRKINNWIEISIEDNGVGMSKQRQATIFDPFISYKLDKGQGIGLTLVKELLKLEEGKVKVTSTLGEGSKFIVSLPGKSR